MRKATSLIAVTGALLTLTPAAYATPAERGEGDITVTAPAAHTSRRCNDSLVVRWRNTTGRDVDIWLAGKGGEGGGAHEHLAQLASHVGARADGELMVLLPRVVKGSEYAVEVASVDGEVHADSHDFEITGG
ncbi:hypothetical protein ACFV3R_17690 [Streptomyces sp. NPDC059740]|uniref:hypothetical protein n=1 Tax=Streptomyces sp. NPDC059740 TaxID=3346926 RepID=UPI003665B8C5